VGDQARVANRVTTSGAIPGWRPNRTFDKRSTGPGRLVLLRQSGRGAAVLLTLFTAVGAAWAHTELEGSDPAADAVLAELPAAVTLMFTTDVQLGLSSVTVTSTSVGGAVASVGELAYFSADQRDVLVLPLTAALPPGGYTVSWRTAGPDGHPISGDYAFQVKSPMLDEDEAAGAADPPAAGGVELAPAAGDEARDPGTGSSVNMLALATRFAFYAAIVGILGAIAFNFLVLGAVGTILPEEAAAAVAARVWGIAAAAAVLLLLTLPLRLWLQAESSFPEDPLGNLVSTTTGTAWSTGWWVQGVAGAIVLVGIGLARPDRGSVIGWRLAALGAMALPVAPLVSGHAWTDSPRALSSLVTYLHVVAASAWVGGLCCLVCAGLPALRDPRGPDAGAQSPLPTLVGAFSRLALVAVGFLVVSGAVKAWLHIGAPSDIWTTAWGRSLLIKDAVVLGVMALGFYNWRVVRPALATDAEQYRLRRSATLELLLGVAAVIATSFLVAQPMN